MEKKHFEEFIKIFSQLKYAALIISGDFNKPRIVEKENEIKQIISELQKNHLALFKNVFDEIENNLSDPKTDPEKYLKIILPFYVDIAPYFISFPDIAFSKEFGKTVVKIDNRTYPKSLIELQMTLIKREAWTTQNWDDISITIPEKYAIMCFRAFWVFFNKLDDLFRGFNIDIMEIQDMVGISVYQRNISKIQRLGFPIPEQNETPNQQTPDNPIIFDDVLLKKFYLAFDNYLWESTDLESCNNWFRVNPIGKPNFKDKMTTYFCYAVGQIEDKIILELRPANLNKWIKPIINGSNYTALKNRKKNTQKINVICDKLALIK